MNGAMSQAGGDAETRLAPARRAARRGLRRDPRARADRARWWAGTRAPSTRARRSSARSTPTPPSWLPNAIARTIGARRVFNRLHARIAVSEAARWTGERYFGGTLRRDPQRGRPRRGAARAEAAVRRAADRVRRARGGAQGPAGAAVCVRRPAPAHPRAAAGDRRRVRRRSSRCSPRSRAEWTASRCSAASTTPSCGAGCTMPTCCARRRWAARASAWS